MTVANTGVFRKEMLIRFSQCDPAGIVYFPHYLIMTNWLVEDWFTQGLGIDFPDFIGKRRLGLPIVKLDCEFLAPSHYGEVLSLTLALTKIGRRSIGLTILGSIGDQLRLRSNQVIVTTTLDTGSSIDIPDDLRASLKHFQGTESRFFEVVKC